MPAASEMFPEDPIDLVFFYQEIPLHRRISAGVKLTRAGTDNAHLLG